MDEPTPIYESVTYAGDMEYYLSRDWSECVDCLNVWCACPVCRRCDECGCDADCQEA